MTDANKAVVLLSGGLDSATVLAIARAQRFDCYALSFAYGQRQAIELAAARLIAEAHQVKEHRLLEIDLRGGSALTGDSPVPKNRASTALGSDIPATYVPARNTVFLAHALAWAEVLGAFDLFIGANAVDYSGYPDCRPAFIAAFEALANVATGAAVNGGGRFTLHAPLLQLSKADIIRRGSELGVDYAATHSCYDPQGPRACGGCDACVLRRRGFAEAGIADPTRYVTSDLQVATSHG